MKFSIMPILVSILAPPKIIVSGLLYSPFRIGERAVISFSISRPAYAGRCAASAAVDAWLRCAVPKASFTKISPRLASSLVKFSSASFSSLWKRVFSSTRISPSSRFSVASWASCPIVVLIFLMSWFRSLPR